MDLIRLDASRKLDPESRAKHGQFLTPLPVARLMASMLEAQPEDVRLLDAGAGVGTLFTAAVSALCQRSPPPKSIRVTAYEIDLILSEYLPDAFGLCRMICEAAGVRFGSELVTRDFLVCAAERADGELFGTRRDGYTAAILNPPYRKINTDSLHRQVLRRIGCETSNLYAGFLAAAIRQLAPRGELVAITPRSFCNGSYFRSFREAFLRDMAIRRLHVFESRQQAFRDDNVLQENVIVRAVKGGDRAVRVFVTSGTGPEDDMPLSREVEYERVVRPGDPQSFIHIATDDVQRRVADRIGLLSTTLAELRLKVSTGPVVDFRVRQHLRESPGQGTAPLIWPTHLTAGGVVWPKTGTKKPNAIVKCSETDGWLVPNEPYVLVKRFTAKEERRRVVAVVSEPHRLPAEVVGFENHLNYFHHGRRGLAIDLARGLAVYLNSTLVDEYFRQFNGHTQVNATDLRNLRYPTEAQLLSLGREAAGSELAQGDMDALVDRELFPMANTGGPDPAKAKGRMQEALDVLQALGFPRQQRNERSALTLLALLNLKSGTPWAKAGNPLCGITPMMDFFRQHYGKDYAPNSRETVRRQTVHQFLDAGLIVRNPDDPTRPTNSDKTVYQVDQSALELLRTFGTKRWDKNLRTYLASVETLQKKYAKERDMSRIPLRFPDGRTLTLSPGGQNVLIKHVVEDFAPRFTPGGKPVYVGDTDEKFAYFDRGALAELGVAVDPHGKMPDVIIHHTAKDWLVLVEAVTSHGPINAKRHQELTQLFGESTAGLVFVTAFLDRKAMVQYLSEMSWETEVWVADEPGHLIHFNGERFLGPYPQV